MKVAMIRMHERLAKKGIRVGEHFEQVLWVHDEFQCEVKPGYEDAVGQAIVDGVKDAGDFFNFKCPLDGEYMVGKSWAETH
jgi:DNA polymerase I-like protein with 3'-5' exonuclease and polymerase domains